MKTRVNFVWMEISLSEDKDSVSLLYATKLQWKMMKIIIVKH